MKGYEYGYAIFGPLLDISISNMNTPTFIQTVISIETNYHNNEIVHQSNYGEIHLLLSSEKLISMQNVTFCKALMKSINEKKLSSSERSF